MQQGGSAVYYQSQVYTNTCVREAHTAVPNDYVAAVVTKDDTHLLHAHAQVSRCAADDRIQPDGVSVDIKSAST